MSLDLLNDPFTGRSLIEASAGTGKTWTLTALYARLLLERRLGVGQILVVTYTTAATAELRERIRARLAALLAVYEGAEAPDPVLAGLHAQYPGEDAHRRLLLAVHGFDEAAIFTIHGFCQRALQDAAFEAGGDFDSELTADDREVLDGLLADLWRAELAAAEPAWARFLAQKRITPQSLRQRLRSHLGKPYLRIEPRDGELGDLGAASEAWTHARDIWLRDAQACLSDLAAFDGLNKRSYDAARFALWQGELDAYFADPAALFAAPTGLEKLGREALSKACKKGFELPGHALNAALQGLLEALEEARPAGEARLIDLQVRLLDTLNRELPARKAAQRMLAFDDLLNRLDQSLQGPAGEALAAALRERYPVALIDEFQDTDPVQYAIFRRIYPGGDEGGDLCFVGDPKQAIYAFRGADLATYLKARDEAARQYSLNTNHRSVPALIAALNRVFDRPLPFAEPGLAYPPVGASDKARAQLVLPEAGAPLELVWLGDEPLGKGEAGNAVAIDTARRIAALLAASGRGEAYFDEAGVRTPLRGGDIAVLVASHRQAGDVAEQLAARGVPSVRRGRDSVWHSAEAEELAAVLAAYAEPGREGVLRYALATRLLGRDAQALARCQDDEHAWDQEREDAERYHQFWQQQGFMRAFRAWLDEQRVAERLIALPDGERRLTNLLHLAELLQTESLQRPGLEPLLAWFNAQRAAESHGDDALLRLESDAERVQIVTVHTSKGLEYPLVFCPYLWDGALLRRDEDITCHAEDGTPLLDLGGADYDDNRERARRERFAERLRLAYVALTRARDRLWLHWGRWPCPGRRRTASCPRMACTVAPSPGCCTAVNCPARRCSANWPATSPRWMAPACAMSCRAWPMPAAATSPWCPAATPRPAPRAKPAPRRRPPWRTCSVACTAPGGSAASPAWPPACMEAPDRDAFFVPPATDPGAGFYGFPGAPVPAPACTRSWRTGCAARASWRTWCRCTCWATACRRTGRRSPSSSCAGAGCRPGRPGLALSRLEPSRRLPELGFTFPVAQLDIQGLRTVLADPPTACPSPCAWPPSAWSSTPSTAS